TYTYCSYKVEKVLGYTQEEIVGKTPFDFMDKEEALRVKKIFKNIVAEKKPIVNLENWNISKDGRRICLLSNGVPIFDDENNFIGYRGADKDITSQKKAEENLIYEHNLFQALMDNMPDLIYFKNTKNRFVRVNKARAKISGTIPENMIGKTDFDFYPEDEAKKCFADDSWVMKTGKPIKDKIEKLTYFDGTKHWVSVTKIPWYNDKGKIIGTIGISRDITEIKKLEDKIRNQNEKLRLTNEKLLELDKMKDDFMSTVSHEFRTPLTSIKGSVDIILKGISGSIDDKAREILSICERNTTRLINLINDFLDLQRIKLGKVKIKKELTDLVSATHKAIEEIQSFAKENKVNLKEDFPRREVKIWVDGDKFSQVIRNLLSNAIKFSPGGTVTVKIEDKENLVKVSVSDTGIGIPRDKLDRVFEKFARIDSGTNKWKGTGLGLSICKEIVQKHKGKIWIESKMGKGSKFTFTLPK
ncbi:PAS domain S-box protein, partial [Candidatus Aerophobetes bacterium]|nr:PAS domain S-box protein [Candidatus Aerophobetes bacterium]